MKLVEASGRELTLGAVAEEETLFVDGSSEPEPFLRVQSGRYAFVCERVGPSEEGDGLFTWRAQFWERAENAEGVEYESVASAGADTESADGVQIGGAFAELFLERFITCESDYLLTRVAASLDDEWARFVLWVLDLLEAMVALLGDNRVPESYDSVALDEV